MAWAITKRPWLRQPQDVPSLDFSNELLVGCQRAFLGTPGGYTINMARPGPWTLNGVMPFILGGAAISTTQYVSLATATPPAAGWTIAAVVTCSATPTNGNRFLGFCQTPGSGTNDRQLMINAAAWATAINDGATKTATSNVIPKPGRVDVLVATGTPSLLSIYVETPLLQPAAAQTNPTSVNNSGFTGYTGTPTFAIGNSASGFAANVIVQQCFYIARPWTPGEVARYLSNPWQLFDTRPRRLWFAPAVSNNMVGGATLNLSKITEQGTGITGSVGSATDTLKALTEQATGITGTVGSARDTLKALTESAFGKTGAVGFGTETLKPITVQATGTVQSNNVVGGATLTLKALLESATGRTGVVGSARDSLRAITEQGTGKTGSVGSGQIILKPITVQAFGESGATPLAPADTSRPGGQAWWGYESFDGSSRPWWYKDLKDKACELERLRQQRIEIGLIPPDKVEETVEEVLEFVEEQPTPATADYYVHKAEMLAARVEKLIDNMMEEDDEQAIMEMSKFFFHRKEARTWQ